MWRCKVIPFQPTTCRITVLTTCITVSIILYVFLNCQEFFLFSSSPPKCHFAEKLAAFISSGPQRFGNVSSELPSSLPLSASPVVGQATVFYVWCGRRRRPFEFRNYLSVRSALRTLRPDTIWFYYESEPVIDDQLYNTWWQELIDDVPFFHRRRLSDIGYRLPRNACEGPGRPSINFVCGLVTSRGGTFVDESTLVVDRPPDDMVTVAMDGGDQSANRLRLLKVGSRTACDKAEFFDTSLGRSSPAVRMLECPSDSELADVHSTVCVHVAQSLYPKDIWTLESDVGRLLRQEFYGRSDIVRASLSYDDLAPNIGHVIWIGGGEMDFLFFLCVLSLLHVAKVDVVYVHGDRPPTGIYWDLLINTHQNVELVIRENAGQVYGQKVGNVPHISDVWRADIMLKYGGIYADTDAVFVRPLSNKLRAYDVVVSYDWPAWNRPFPDILNLGVIVSKPGTRFWELCLKSMKWFRDDDWTFNGLRQPYRVMERHPELVHVEPRLQVICFQTLCHPTWWPDYHDERVNHLSPPAGQPPLDWRHDTFAFHFTDILPPEFRNPKALLKGNGMYVEIRRMILEAADMAKYFR